MEHLKRLMFGMLMAAGIVSAQAQIGYQISLLNTATGEPRANEKVNVTVTLTNNEGGVIFAGNQSATTNDFGVLSLTIGNADTFKNVDLSKMPFWVEVSANGVMIGKSQVLSVPVAEVAKRVAPGITKEELCSKVWYLWNKSYVKLYVKFFSGGRVNLVHEHFDEESGSLKSTETYRGSYEVEGSTLWLYMDWDWDRDDYDCLLLRYYNGELHLIADPF